MYSWVYNHFGVSSSEYIHGYNRFDMCIHGRVIINVYISSSEEC